MDNIYCITTTSRIYNTGTFFHRYWCYEIVATFSDGTSHKINVSCSSKRDGKKKIAQHRSDFMSIGKRT